MNDLKFRGVFKHKDGGFIAKIGHNGKQVYLGMFSNFEDAKSARLKAETYCTTARAVVEVRAL